MFAPPHHHQGPAQAGPGGGKVGKILVFQWIPVCRHSAMPGPESVLCGVKQHSGMVRRPCLAPCRLGPALDSARNSNCLCAMAVAHCLYIYIYIWACPQLIGKKMYHFALVNFHHPLVVNLETRLFLEGLALKHFSHHSRRLVSPILFCPFGERLKK